MQATKTLAGKGLRSLNSLMSLVCNIAVPLNTCIMFYYWLESLLWEKNVFSGLFSCIFFLEKLYSHFYVNDNRQYKK